MAGKKILTDEKVDALLKSMLVFSRAVDHVIETRAVDGVSTKQLSRSKVQILRLLAKRGQQTSTQVARFLGVTKPAVSQIISSMVRSKLVARRPAKKDRREVFLELTARGKVRHAAIRRAQRHLLRSVLRNSRLHDVPAWTGWLQEMAGALAQAEQDLQDFCLQCGAHADDTCVLVGGDANCLFLQHDREKSGSPRRGRARR